MVDHVRVKGLGFWVYRGLIFGGLGALGFERLRGFRGLGVLGRWPWARTPTIGILQALRDIWRR